MNIPEQTISPSAAIEIFEAEGVNAYERTLRRVLDIGLVYHIGAAEPIEDRQKQQSRRFDPQYTRRLAQELHTSTADFTTTAEQFAVSYDSRILTLDAEARFQARILEAAPEGWIDNTKLARLAGVDTATVKLWRDKKVIPMEKRPTVSERGSKILMYNARAEDLSLVLRLKRPHGLPETGDLLLDYYRNLGAGLIEAPEQEPLQ